MEELKEFVNKCFKCRSFRHLIIELQELGVPPAQAFICLTYEVGDKLFRKYIRDNNDRRAFGKLIGKEMNKLGYVKKGKKEQNLYLHHAKMFIKK